MSIEAIVGLLFGGLTNRAADGPSRDEDTTGPLTGGVGILRPVRTPSDVVIFLSSSFLDSSRPIDVAMDDMGRLSGVGDGELVRSMTALFVGGIPLIGFVKLGGGPELMVPMSIHTKRWISTPGRRNWSLWWERRQGLEGMWIHLNTVRTKIRKK